MIAETIQSKISASDLSITPGNSTASLEVDVINSSDRYASFHIVLATVGQEDVPSHSWYNLPSMASSKVAPGTHSRYSIRIFDTPLPGFVGLANVTIRIISPELQSEERHVLRLRIQPGAGVAACKVALPQPNVEEYPGQLLEIPARIFNNSRNMLSVFLSYPGLETWKTSQSPSQCQLMPNRWHNITLTCQIPETLSRAQARAYPFQIVAVDPNGESAIAEGTLTVLPIGNFVFRADKNELTIPRRSRWRLDRSTTTQTNLYIENLSNQKESFDIETLSPITGAAPNWPYEIDLASKSLTVEPGQAKTQQANITAQRPWIGWGKQLLIYLQARAQSSALALKDDEQTLQVWVLPIVPRWMQLLLLMILSGVLSGLWMFQSHQQQHHQLVSTVQFNGTGTQVISGSSDQTIRQWQVSGRRLHPTNDTLLLPRAARVVRYRPVNNNQLITGLENGEIQLWDLLKSPSQSPRTLINREGVTPERDDRVMAIALSDHASHLFSGYGSGQITQWDIAPGHTFNESSEPIRHISIPELAISDIALVAPEQQTLAIAGRYNKLFLWNWRETTASSGPVQLSTSTSTLTAINYPTGSQNDYITSLTTAEKYPMRLATADNQGRLTLWDLESCLNRNDACTVLDQWQSEKATAIRSIALSANGCYLTSADDSGHLILWPLSSQGRRLTKYLQGQSVNTFKSGLNSVDIKIRAGKVMLVSGTDDHQVRLHQLKSSQQACN